MSETKIKELMKDIFRQNKRNSRTSVKKNVVDAEKKNIVDNEQKNVIDNKKKCRR